MPRSIVVDLLLTGAMDTPWPLYLGGSTVVEGRIGVNAVCRIKCVDKPCWKQPSSLIGTRCPLGLTVYEGRINEIPIKVFGVVGPQHREDLPTHRDFKLACKGRSVTAQDFAAWLQRVKALVSATENSSDQRLAEALEPLHDAMRLARDVEQLSMGMIKESYPGQTDAFEVATPMERALVKTSALLVDTFDVLEVYLNPQAAAFGGKKQIEPYKLLDMLCKIASLARRQENRPSVRLMGGTFRWSEVFDSFKLIPFVLIDNAQKYSRPGAAVIVEVEERGNTLVVRVISEGPFIVEGERDRIFQRGYRANAAGRVNPGGMGVGLYVAQTVAAAHGLFIHVESTPLGFEFEGTPQARNIFSFMLRCL